MENYNKNTKDIIDIEEKSLYYLVNTKNEAHILFSKQYQ